MKQFLILSVTLIASAALVFTSGPLRGRPTAAGDLLTMRGAAPLVSEPKPPRQDVVLTVDGKRYKGETRLVDDGTTYVLAADFLAAVDLPPCVTADGDGTVRLDADGLTLTANPDDLYVVANGRYLWCPLGVFTEDGSLWLPLRPLAAAAGCTVEWDDGTETAAVSSGGGTLPSGDGYYDEDDVFWLSRIINAEAGGECFLGKVAVGNVVLNRTRSREFPGTIYEVIFDIRFGVQFSPIKSGSIYKTPNEDSVVAAKLCLDGAVINDEMLYFYNPKKSKSTWMREKCTFVASIGNHDFFS